MKSIFLKTASLLLWIWFLITSIIITPIFIIIWLLTFWWDKNLRISHLSACFWAAQNIWINPFWSLKIIDRHKFNTRATYMVMTNHQSALDIFVIDSLFKHFKWVSKSENFKIPFLGWILTFDRAIKVFRGDSEAFGKFRVQVVRSLKQKNSIMVFPEGTRSKTGKLGRFMDGAFILAMETKTDILPMVIDGTGKAIPKKGWSLKGKQKLKLKVLDPLPYEEWKDKSLHELKLYVRNIISDELTKLRSHD
ncbi:MAG: 1-acyl-sn-glycerol-3-phosphate acyltransferase [Bacteroidales bacterium]|nr:1-acyl-sn-glycerol-3-phosphate acyltransferase [Bacteroidales bacterium]MCF8390225.1 1-acyl-sn-glycerol-3-phosphate acyltransferase [Bacteroidales bacterium]